MTSDRGAHRRTGTAVLLLLVGSGCMVGPNYVRPATPVAATWLEAGEAAVRATPADGLRWWAAFGDPTLTRLVETAYAQNLTLRTAGVRVLEAQARRAIAIGGLFPQTQEVTGAYTRTLLSANGVIPPFFGRGFDNWQAGFDASWELDLWGKLRRGVEAADADLLGAVAGYDDVLVSLLAEVATTYVGVRVDDERLAVARDNVRAQRDGLRIARVRWEAGGTSELDVQQATTLLRDTQATIPALEIERRRAVDSLCVLLGGPPQDLGELLGGPGHVPEVPATVTVGIPAELLRRRPDVRSAELAAAAQSARIGVAVADLLPAFELTGSVGLSAQDAAKFFEGRSFQAMAGPTFTWPVLNYGRLVGNVRLQDATFHELALAYASAVLLAQQEVEDALVGYLRGTARVRRLTESVAAADRAVELALVQYREGATDYTAVLNAQQAKLKEEDLLASTRGSVALSVIALYKALGGGWEIRDGHDFVPAALRAGGPRAAARGAAAVARAAADERPRRWWQWRWWWPEW
ncbi:MAG TPA: efflux transporter outer membrane subunit [Candidatus Binatia bacterium]|nr:efflux transporter outer membrane subunit [Candidatus Binatia bacterium]